MVRLAEVSGSKSRGRQEKVFKYIYLRTAEIAYLVGCSEHNVEAAIALLMIKFNVKTRAGLLWAGMAAGAEIDDKYLHAVLPANWKYGVMWARRKAARNKVTG